MKKTISIIVIVAMLLSTVLAIIPMSAAEAEKTNVLFSDAKAADYQFAGKGNVFYYDYHYYVDTLNTFPMTNKAPSLRVGNNSGSGTASATDGKPFEGSMNHSYSDDCAELKLADGSTVKHDHVFGYSFKESVTIDSFKLYVTAGKDGRDDINKVTVYGASVDPAIKYDSYESGKYYYSTVTELYKMADGADVQANKQVEGDKTAAVVSGDFAAPATVDYILFAVDFNTISAKKYTVLEAEAYGVVGEPEAPEAPEEEEEPTIDEIIPVVKDNGMINWADLTYKSLFKGAESADKFDEVYNVVIDGSTLTTSAKDTTNNDKSYNLGYVAKTEYAITADSYYVYELKAKLNRDTGYAGFVFAVNGDEHYFAGGAFANDGDHDNADGSRASHIVLYKGDWGTNFNKTFGDRYPVPTAVENGYGSWRIIYEGLTVKVQYVAKDGNWTYITDDEGNVCSIELPEGSYVAVGAHNRGGAKGKDRTIVVKDAKIYDLNDVDFEKLVKYAAEEKIDWSALTYKSLFKGAESADKFDEVYNVVIDGSTLTTSAKDTTNNDKGYNLGYVAKTEYAITADSYYVYELKAKLNRDTGYAGFVFAVNGDEHYFAGGAFANDGDHDNADGSRASHIVLYKGDWGTNFNKTFGDRYPVPTAVENGYGSWRIIYEGLTVKVQYVAKDGNWTYITDDEGNVCSIELPEGSYVAVGAHNRGGAKGKDRTIVVKDAKILDLNNLDFGVGPAITTPEEFVAALAQGGEFFLLNDIVLPENYVPADFTGSIDGQGFSVTVKNTSVFATLTDATVANLTIKGAIDVEGNTAALADKAEGTVAVMNVTVDLDTLKGGETGAFIRSTSKATVSFKDCVNKTEVNATGKGAGFVAYAAGNVSFENCQNLASVYGGNDTAGFVADYEGGANALTITNCVNGVAGKTTVKGVNGNGGFVGEASGKITVTDSTNYSLIFNNGTSDWDSTAGGIVGMFANRGSDNTVTIKGVVNYGDIKTRDQWYQGAGGIVGSAKWKADTKCYFEDTINYGSCVKTGTGPNLGGFIGYTDNGDPVEFIFKNCKNYGDFRSNGNNGGFVGQAGSKNTVFENCENYGDIRSHNNMAGGFCGWQKHTKITLKNCANYGTITANSKYASGLVSGPECADVTADNCANYGRLIGKTDAAGLVHANGGTLTNCVNYGALSVANANGKIFAIANDKMTIDATCKNEGVIGYTEVATADDFMAMKAGGLYVLTANIVLPADYTAIDFGAEWYQAELNGNGYTVTLKSDNGASIFNNLASAKIYNVNFKGSSDFTADQGFIAKEVVGAAKVAFENVNVDAFIAGSKNAAAYVGKTSKTLVSFTAKNCTFTGLVHSASRAGAFAPKLSSGTAVFENCTVGAKYVETMIVGGSSTVGGFVSFAEDCDLTFKNCVNYADVAAQSGDKSTGAYTGGFIGNTEYANVVIANCVNGVYGETFVQSNGSAAAGFIGNAYGNITITDSVNYSRAITKGKENWAPTAAGIIGLFANDSAQTHVLNLKGVKNYGDLETLDQWYQGAGGIIGNAKSWNGVKSYIYIEDTANYGSLVKNGTGPNLGGFIGYTDGKITELVIKNSQNYGDFRSNGNNSGFIGQVATKSTVIENCQNYGDIRSHNNMAGGFAGWQSHDAMTLKDCANYGKIVSNSKYAAGFVSGVDSKNVNADGCVNYGVLAGKTDTAGIVHAKGGEIKNCVNYGILTVANADGKIFAIANDDMTVDATCKDEGAVLTNADLAAKANAIAGSYNDYDAAAYAEVVKAFAAAQTAIDNAKPVVDTKVVTAKELFANVTVNSYAGHNGTHTLDGVTYETNQVMVSNQTGTMDALQFQKAKGTLTAKNVSVNTLVIVVYSTYDYTANFTVTVGGKAVTLPAPAVTNATGVKTGVKNNNGFEYSKYTMTVALDETLTGDLVIKDNLNYAIYLGSVEYGVVTAGDPSEALAAVDAAIAKLVNVEALNDALAAADLLAVTYGEADYTAETWAAYAAALEAAKAVNVADQAAVDAAAKALADAQAALVYVGALNYYVAKAESLDAVNYTKSTWAELQAVLAAAKAVDLKDQAAIDAAVEALDEAIYNLGDISATADTTKKAIAAAKALAEADYTVATWALLLKAIETAEASLASGDADVMDAATVALNEAVAELISIAELNALIAEAEALVAGDYTNASWSALAVALRAAKAALVATSQVTVDNAAANLAAAKAALVNTADLQAAIADVEALNSADYTADSWAKVASALASAKLALVAADAEGVKAAADALAAAKAALVAFVPVDTSALSAAIADAETLNKADYTADSWSAFVAALSAAKAALYGEQADVDAAVAALAAAKAALAAKPDVAALEAAIAEIKALVKADYTSATWEALETALAAAKAALKADAQADVDAAVAALAAAKAALAEMPDTAALEAAIAEIKALYANDYTAETWAALADAFAAAKAALKAEAQADVDAAVAALAAAKAALEEKPAPVEPGEDETEPTEPVQKPTEKPTEPVEQDGCGGVIGAAAVVITAVLGLGVTVLKKKD